jgi:selenocysteine-specific elongation factor
MASRALALFEKNRTNPPTKRELALKIANSEAIVRFMCQQKILVELPEGILFERKHYEAVRDEIINFLRSHGTISIQEVRNLLGFSRKHILPLLSKLDEEGVTRRQGDERVLLQH